MVAALIISICLLLNALLSCAEMAFVTIDKRLLHKEVLAGNKNAIAIANMHEFPERILSVVQIGITLVGAISAAISGLVAEDTISPYIMWLFTVQEETAESIAIISVVVPLTILSVIIGELVPKSVAIRYSFRICMLFAPGLRIAEKLLGFLVNPMERITHFIVRLIWGEEKITKESEASEVSLAGLKTEHKEYVHNIIDLAAKNVSHAMIKWETVKTIDSIASATEVNEAFLQFGHTRMPVMVDNEVYGFIHLKEFLHILKAGAGDNWLSFVRAPRFITPNMKLFNALKEMKTKRVQILIVGTASNPIGILTLADVIGEVVGDIDDDNEDKKIVGFLRHMVIQKPGRTPKSL